MEVLEPPLGSFFSSTKGKMTWLGDLGCAVVPTLAADHASRRRYTRTFSPKGLLLSGLKVGGYIPISLTRLRLLAANRLYLKPAFH